MKLLAVETSTEACSAALYIDEQIQQKYKIAPREHSLIILSMIDELLVEGGITSSALDVIAFGRGPGSFMGIRIATGIAKGIAYAHDLPVVPISTLAALAQSAHQKYQANKVLAVIDARMKEIYSAAYTCDEDGLMTLQDEEVVVAPEQINVPVGDGWLGAGSGWSMYSEQLSSALGACLSGTHSESFPDAESVAVLAVKAYQSGYSVSAETAMPVYIRDNVAKKPANI